MMDKHTLKQYQAILREIDQLEQEKQRVLSRLLSPSPPDGQPHGSGSPDKIGEAVARRDKYQRLIDRKLDELISLREQIETAIESLPPNDRRLLRLRYIEGMTWEQLAVEMNYNYRWVLRLHGRILRDMANRP